MIIKMILTKVKLLVATVMVLAGLYMVVFGDAWGQIVFELMAGSETGLWVEHFVPFLPMAIIGFGAALFASAKQGRGAE